MEKYTMFMDRKNQYSVGSPRHGNKEEKEIKEIQIGKEEVKLAARRCHDTIHIKP